MTLMSYKIERFPITQDEITRVMDRFYDRIRHHAILGPVFAAHVGETDADWAHHIAKINGFWARALLGTPGYDGNPMAAHVGNPLISLDHFPIWLGGLFEDTLAAELPAEVAAAWGGPWHTVLRAGFVWRWGGIVRPECRCCAERRRPCLRRVTRQRGAGGGWQSGFLWNLELKARRVEPCPVPDQLARAVRQGLYHCGMN